MLVWSESKNQRSHFGWVPSLPRRCCPLAQAPSSVWRRNICVWSKIGKSWHVMLAPTWAIQENEKTNGHKKHGNVTIKHDTNYKDSFWCRYLSPTMLFPSARRNPARANKTRQSGRLVLRFSGNQCHLTRETFVRPLSCVVSYAETPRHLNDAAKTCKFDSSFSHGETARQRSLWQGRHLNSFDVELRKQIKGAPEVEEFSEFFQKEFFGNRIKWFSDIHFTKRSKSSHVE